MADWEQFESGREEEILDRLEVAQDELEAIVSDAGDRDNTNYSNLLKIRVRKAGGRHYLALFWYGESSPEPSVIYAPLGLLMGMWYKGIDTQGNLWENGLDLEE